MELKLLGVFAVIIAAAAIGYEVGENAKRQLHVFENLRHAVTLIRSEIGYALTPIKELFEMLSTGNDEIWTDFFRIVSKELDRAELDRNIGEIWADTLDKVSVSRYMSKEDQNELKRFGRNLGSYDKNSQLNKIDLFIDYIDRRITVLDSGLSERVRLCRILGVAAGVFVTILMV